MVSTTDLQDELTQIRERIQELLPRRNDGVSWAVSAYDDLAAREADLIGELKARSDR